MAQCPGVSSLTFPVLHSDLGSGEEPAAPMQPTTNQSRSLLAVENQR
jgi:hypothetical protein